ncbi:hypothetical protein INT80_14065 [Gallibacterium anatis]|uniref:Transposase n=1 Tax=Gallibacterium anatis TaxID=750 RepID=A0A930UVQ0_9PAST|nr:hypothetical protein [Gallibacterium anatis]
MHPLTADFLLLQCVKQHGLIQSMSRRGNCWDNVPMGRWFRSFKYKWMLYDRIQLITIYKQNLIFTKVEYINQTTAQNSL